MNQAVTFNTIGRFGNNLFQFAAAKLTAHLLGLPIHNPLEPESFFNIFKTEKNNTPQPFINFNDNNFKELILNAKNKTYIDHIKNNFNGTLYLNGYFQYSWAYGMFKDVVKDFFTLPQTEINETDIAMHVRLGDFYFCHYNSGIISPEWYLNILKTKTFNKLYIVVEQPTNKNEEEYLLKFNSFNPVIVSNTLIEDFNFLRKFKKIILSNSTFSWWAAFLGCSQEVTLPENYNCFGVDGFSGKHEHQEIWDVRGFGEKIPCSFIDVYKQ